MAMSPQDFHAHASAAADDEGRLPLSRMEYWEIFPFEPDALKVVALAEPVLPEPPRQGEDGVDCTSCAKSDVGIWRDDKWRLIRFAKVGVPLLLLLMPRVHHDLADLSGRSRG